MPRTYEPIASQTLGSNTASVTFSSIPATYTDLVVLASIRTVHGATQSVDCYVRFNGDTASNYSRTYLYGSGSSAASGRESSQTRIGAFYAPGGGATSNVFSAELLTIPSYANTNVYKTVLSSAGYSEGLVSRLVGLWRSTSAITSIEIGPASETMVTGTTISLYGIKAA